MPDVSTKSRAAKPPRAKAGAAQPKTAPARGRTSKRVARPPTPEPDALDTSVINEHIGFQLRWASLAFFRNLESAFERLELRPSLVGVLLAIEANPGRKQQDICRAVGVTRPNLVALIDDLEQRGLVRRHPADQDGRSYALKLTAVGVVFMKEVHAINNAQEQLAFAALGADKDAFLRGLRSIVDMREDRPAKPSNADY